MKKNKNHENKKTFFKNFKAIINIQKDSKKYLILFLLCNISLTIISVIAPILSAQKLIALSSGLFNKLFIIILATFLIEILRNINFLLSDYIYAKLYFNLRKQIQMNLLNETLKITQQDLNNNSSGLFIERINNDTEHLAETLSSLIDSFANVIGNIGIIIVLFFINIYLGIASVLMIIIIMIYHNFSSNINYQNRSELKKSREKTGGFFSEIVCGSKDIKILNAEESFLKKAQEYTEETNKIAYKYQKTKANLYFLGGSIRDLLDLIINIIVFLSLTTNFLSIETSIIVYNYHPQLAQTADWIKNLYELIKQFNLSANRILGILEDKEFSKEQFGNINIAHFQGKIEFKNVYFSYQKDKPVLKNISLTINPNETVGFVGPTGTGKSTIFNLISALNYPDSGEILFDNINIKKLNKNSIRGNLSVISQNAYIFNMSILDNLKIVKNTATFEEIKEAVHLACLDEFIESLPNKYDTIVGEGGVNLSGGEKQRLAIARALLLKTEILLFDEATSALDNETQSKIKEAINNLKGEYTILIIAHRLSTIIDADKIYVINDGQVEACGNHKTLINHSEVYKKLYFKEASIK